MPALYINMVYQILSAFIKVNTAFTIVLSIILFLLYLNIFIWFICKGNSKSKFIQKYLLSNFNKKLALSCFISHFAIVVIFIVITFFSIPNLKKDYEVTEIDGQLYAVLAHPENNILICPLHSDEDNTTLDTGKYKIISESGVEYSYVTFKNPPIIVSGK